jgi:hypothetical protein
MPTRSASCERGPQLANATQQTSAPARKAILGLVMDNAFGKGRPMANGYLNSSGILLRNREAGTQICMKAGSKLPYRYARKSPVADACLRQGDPLN